MFVESSFTIDSDETMCIKLRNIACKGSCLLAQIIRCSCALFNESSILLGNSLKLADGFTNLVDTNALLLSSVSDFVHDCCHLLYGLDCFINRLGGLLHIFVPCGNLGCGGFNQLFDLVSSTG